MPPKFYKKRKSRKGRSAATLARTALRKVNNIIKAEEIKKADNAAFESPISIDWTGLTVPLTAVISTGTNAYTRIGREVNIKYVSFNGILKHNPAAGIGVSNTVRFIFFVDRQQIYASDPATSEVLETPLGVITSPFKRYNRNTVGRFRILRDFKVLLNSHYPQKIIKTNLSFKKGHKQSHNGNGQSDDCRGTIYLLMISDIGVVPNAPTFEGSCRVGFNDD